MAAPTYHIFPCISFRLSGSEQHLCSQHRGEVLLDYLEAGIAERDLDAVICNTGCDQCCDNGPVLVVQPGNQRFESVDRAAIDGILDSLMPAAVAG